MSAQEPPRRPPPPSQAPTERLGEPIQPQQPGAPGAQPPAYERVPPAWEPPRWYQSPGAVVAIGLLALLIGGLAGYLIGHESESEKASGVTRTVTNTATVTQPKTVTQTNTVTASTVKETPSPATEARLRETEASLRKAEKENQELKHQLEEGGRSP